MVMPKAEDGFVYFADIGEAIKIGMATDPVARFRQLQTGQHKRVRMIGIMPGGRRREAAIHAKLSGHRIRGDWFEGSAKVRAIIACLLDSNPQAVKWNPSI